MTELQCDVCLYKGDESEWGNNDNDCPECGEDKFHAYNTDKL